MINKILVIAFFLSLVLVGCSSKTGPEETLKKFISYRFSSGQSKEKIMEQSTGELFRQVESMGEKEFELFRDMGNRKLVNFKILSKQCEQNRCKIIYYISYSTQKQGNEKLAVSEVKKVAEIVKVQDVWKISDVSNIKTFHNMAQPINP